MNESIVRHQFAMVKILMGLAVKQSTYSFECDISQIMLEGCIEWGF